MTPAARMGRPPALDQDRIAEAVLDVGFDELTFAAVRDRLGVGQTTLYRHVADRNELVRIGLDHALTHADWPDRDGPWRKVLEEHAVALWRLWAQHPGMATEAARGIVPPTMLRMTDELCAVLLRQGFTPERAVLACDIVFDMVTDNRRGIEHVNATALTDADRHANEGWRSFLAPRQSDDESTGAEREAIHAALKSSVTSDPFSWFTQKLEVVLTGIEHALVSSE